MLISALFLVKSGSNQDVLKQLAVHKLVQPENELFFSAKKKCIYKAVERHGRNLYTFYQEKEVNQKALHTIVIQLIRYSKKEKLWRQ